MDEASEHRPNFDAPQVVDPTETAAPILAQLDDVDAKIASWSREAAAGGLRAEDIRAGHEALGQERARLEDQLAAGTPAAPAFEWDEWIAALPGETRALLDAVIERITIAPAAKLGRVFDPVWRSAGASGADPSADSGRCPEAPCLCRGCARLAGG